MYPARRIEDQRGKDWELIAPMQQHNERVIDMNNFLDKMRDLAGSQHGAPGSSENVAEGPYDAVVESQTQ